MKKYLLTILVAISLLAILSCEKEKDDPWKETAEKLHGKWQIDSLAITETRVDEVNKKTYVGTTADYVEFTTDGLIRVMFRGKLDVGNYSIQSETVFLVDGDDVKIRELTDKDFIFYFKDNNGVIGYIEQTYYLKR